ncbi:MAG TPA: cupin domain-containing protein [Clostridia bacterium]|nr:cupin domain-containing protein [Clostridia bacterium]
MHQRNGTGAHSHPSQEIYEIFAGEGIVTVDGESEKVKVGDIIIIPADSTHSIKPTGEELLWLAYWWMD